MKYSLLILSQKVDSFERSNSNVQMLGLALYESFVKLSKNSEESIHVEHGDYKNCQPHVGKKFDCVLVVCYAEDSYLLAGLKRDLGCRLLVAFNEIPFNCDCVDFSFVCNSSYRGDERQMYAGLPFVDSLLKISKKEPGSVLVDHVWEPYLGTPRDRTGEIAGWLRSDESKKLKIYRMIRWSKGEADDVTKDETIVKFSAYAEYIRNTDHISTMVVTHKESFGWSVVDMVARGARVVAPRGFLSDFLVEKFRIPVFENRQEFLALVHLPELTDAEKMKNRGGCVSFDEAVKVVDNKLKCLLQ